MKVLLPLAFVLTVGCATTDVDKAKMGTMDTMTKVCEIAPSAVGTGFDLFAGFNNLVKRIPDIFKSEPKPE